MTKLNQIVAVVNGKKTKVQKALTDVYHKIQKAELFQGISRTYKPLNEDGETQPPEQKLVQYTVGEAIKEAQNALTELLDVVLTQDNANTQAKADIVVDGQVVATQVPVTYLLFLEKQLVDLHTFVSKLPVLDMGDTWFFDSNRNNYATPAFATNRTKKVYRNHVKAEATEKHPAQVEVFTEDVKVGEWSTVKFSGCVPAQDKQEMLVRVSKLQEAVKFARESANSIDIEQQNIGEKLFDFVFKK